VNIDLLRKRAEEELSSPQFELTKQFLAVNIIERDESSNYVCDRYEINSEENTISFYFKIEGEEYFFCVLINLNGNDVTWVYPENSNRCYLTATSEELSLKELSEITRLNYSSGWSKGDIRKNGSAYTFSRINFEFYEKKSYAMEILLALVLDEVEKDKEGVIELAKKACASISICKHQYISANAGIFLDAEIMARLSSLNLKLDIDMYIAGEERKWA